MIVTIDGIRDASVVIVRPEDKLFAADQRPVSASVQLRIDTRSDLSTNRKKILGLQRLILQAVEGLKEENLVITLTHLGYIKRIGAETYRTQKRGGKGIAGVHTAEDDYVQDFLTTTNHRDKATFDEGARLIRKAISDSPDTDGAGDALRVLASELLARRDWVGAADSFAQVLEIWPEMARDASVQEGYGQALMNLGRTEEALSVFLRAEACAKTDDEKVSAIIRSGDALAALGRLDDSMAKYRDVQTRFPKTTAAARLADIVRIRELEAKGRSLYRDFRFAEAQKCFAEVAAHDAARRGRMSYYEVLCLYGQGRDKDAERRAQELLESSDDLALRADVTRWLARAAFNRSRWTEADQLFSAYAALSVVPAADADEARVWSARAALAANDFDGAIARAAEVVKASSDGAVCARAQAVQGEALLELGRFDEAVYVFERAASVLALPPAERMEIQILRADALFALGADNSLRYEEALGVYRTLVQAENVSPEDALSLAYKIGMTLEKLKRRDEALDQYYSGVVLAYRDLRQRRERLGDRAKAVFARAAFRLADICESRGSFEQAIRTLELVSSSDVPAADEAARRIERIRMKGILP